MPSFPATVTAASIAALALLTMPVSDPVSANDLEIDAETLTLPNGMTVVLYPDRTLPKVVVNTWFHVGSKDEREKRTGFAHLFEHLMFMGTERVPDNRYDLLLEGGGGWSNASTSSDRTNYYNVGPSAMLPTMLWLEADRLDGLAEAMTQEKLDAQRDVVRNERRETENAPYGRADLAMSEAMYPQGHPYHHPIIGSHEDLEAATVDDVKDFFRRYYVPGNATVVVAGDFDPQEVRPLVERTFGVLPVVAAPEHKTAPAPELSHEVRMVHADKVEFPRLTLAWHSPAFYRDGDGEMDLVASILAGGSASRLEKRLVLADGIAQRVVAYQSSAELSSMFVVEATASADGDPETIKQAILEELATFIAGGPTDAELKRAKAQIEASFLRRMESLPRRADQINAYRHYFGVTDGFQRDLDRWTKPDAEGVRAWAERVLGPGRVDMRVFPEIPDSMRAALDERPEDFAPGAFAPPVAATFALSNGIAVHAVERPGTRLFSGRVVVSGGENHVSAEKAGLTDLTARMMDSGSGGLDASEFAEAVESLGASVWVAGGRATTTAGVTGLSSRLDETLDLFADLVLRPNLMQEDFEREKRLALARVRARRDDPGALARQVGRALLFEDGDPRHRPFGGMEATVSALTLEDVRAHAQGMFRPDRAEFLFVGDFELGELQDALDRRFRKWKERGDLPPAPGMRPSDTGGAFVLLDRPDAPQIVVYASRMVPRLEDQENAVRNSASTIFGGSFTSRVNTNLRERNGYTYGAYGRVIDGREYSYLMMTSDVFTDVTGAALAEMRRECNGMAKSPPTDDEVVKALETRRSDLIDTAETTWSASVALADLIDTGRPLDGVARDLAALREVTADEVRAFAGTGFWNWDDLRVVLVGDRKKILPQLAEAGFPEPQLVDEYGHAVESAARP